MGWQDEHTASHLLESHYSAVRRVVCTATFEYHICLWPKPQRQAAVREFICTVKVHRRVAAASQLPDWLSVSVGCTHQHLICIHPSASFFFNVYLTKTFPQLLLILPLIGNLMIFLPKTFYKTYIKIHNNNSLPSSPARLVHELKPE